MKNSQPECVGKVFVVVQGMRRCLICEHVFTPMEAAEHSTTPCYPHGEASEDSGTPDR